LPVISSGAAASLIERIAAGAAMDAADDWIAERAERAISSITSDIRWRAVV